MTSPGENSDDTSLTLRLSNLSCCIDKDFLDSEVPIFENVPQALIHDFETNFPVPQDNHCIFPEHRPSVAALKKTCRHFASSYKTHLRRLGKAVFGIVILFQVDTDREIPDDIDLENVEKASLVKVYGKAYGTGFYLGAGRIMTNAHLVTWPKDLPPSITDEHGLISQLEARIYILHGPGELTRGVKNRWRARVEQICPALMQKSDAVRPSGMLPAGDIATQNDWAVLAINSAPKTWPKDKYAVSPITFPPETPLVPTQCFLMGVNRRNMLKSDGFTRLYARTPESCKQIEQCVDSLQPNKISYAAGVYTMQDSGELLHDISTFGGSSGSPIFMLKNGECRLVGLHAAGNASRIDEQQSLNIGLSLSTTLCMTVADCLRDGLLQSDLAQLHRMESSLSARLWAKVISRLRHGREEVDLVQNWLSCMRVAQGDPLYLPR